MYVYWLLEQKQVDIIRIILFVIFVPGTLWRMTLKYSYATKHDNQLQKYYFIISPFRNVLFAKTLRFSQ